MRVMAGIVTYNPDINRLKENIEAVVSQVEELMLVDNYSNNKDEIQSLVSQFSHVRVKWLEKNFGIAKALNEIGYFALHSGYDWFLTLDQDSIAEPGLIEGYGPYLNEAGVGQLTCTLMERGTNTEGYKMDAKLAFVEVKDAITSGSLVKTEVFVQIGGFDEDLFIDTVDTDFNYRLIQNQFKTLRVNKVGILHELGKTKRVRFLGKNHTIVSHSHMRYYYIFRNEIILTRRYKEFFDYNRRIFLTKYIRSILALDDHKVKNFIAISRGVMAGLTYNLNDRRLKS